MRTTEKRLLKQDISKNKEEKSMKKNVLAIAAAFFAVLVLTSNSVEARDCYFLDAPDVKAPAWVCSDLYQGEGVIFKGYPYTAVGSEKCYENEFSFSLKFAVMDARNNLASRIRTIASRELRKFANLIVSGSDKFMDKYYDETAINLAHVVLEDTPVLDTVISPKNTIYVIVGISDLSGRRIVQKTMKSAFGEKRADFVRELGEKNFDRLQKRLENIENAPEFMEGGGYTQAKEPKWLYDPKTGEVSPLKKKETAKKEE